MNLGQYRDPDNGSAFKYIGSTELFNEIVRTRQNRQHDSEEPDHFGAMGMGQVQDYDGRLSQRLIDHYVARARGGTGLNRVSREVETSMDKKVPLINDLLHVAPLNELLREPAACRPHRKVLTCRTAAQIREKNKANSE